MAEKVAATFHPAYQCEICGDTLTSYRAMMECEARCEAEDKAARMPARSIMRPVREWDDD